MSSSPSPDFARFVSGKVHPRVLTACDDPEIARKARKATPDLLTMLGITTHGSITADSASVLADAFGGILRCDSAAHAATAAFIDAVRSAPAPASGSGQKRSRSEPTECTEPLQAPPSSHKKAKTAEKVQELTAEADALIMCPISRGPIVDAVSVNGHFFFGKQFH